jgi:integrase
MPKPIYERRVVEFRPRDVVMALSRCESIKGLVAEYRDTKSVGLTLRITPGQAVWYLRRRDMTLRLGSAFEIELWKARYMADHIRLAAKKKRDLRAFVKIMISSEVDPTSGKKSIVSAATADMVTDQQSEYNQHRLFGSPDDTWTWAQLTHHFLENKKPKLKERYREKYARFLKLDAFKAIAERRVCELKIADLERVRDRILVDHKRSTVHRALRQGKEMLSWAWKFQATRSGLDQCEHQWWDRWSFDYETKARTRSPTIDEIARTLLIAEKHRDLAPGEHGTYPGTLGALWAVALTAQRTGPLLGTRRDQLFDTKKVGKNLRGWKVMNWDADEMKGGRGGGRSHSLPIPPEGLAILDRFHEEAGGNSPWMFPSKDARNRITPSALNLLIYRLQGRVFDDWIRRKPERPGKPGPKPSKERKKRQNLFDEYKIRHWSPHDVRRTMTTFLSDHGLGGSATAILAHKIPHEQTNQRELTAPVTELHYNLSQKIDLKAEGMQLWVKALLAAYRREDRNLRSATAVSFTSVRRRQKSWSKDKTAA